MSLTYNTSVVGSILRSVCDFIQGFENIWLNPPSSVCQKTLSVIFSADTGVSFHECWIGEVSCLAKILFTLNDTSPIIISGGVGGAFTIQATIYSKDSTLA